MKPNMKPKTTEARLSMTRPVVTTAECLGPVLAPAACEPSRGESFNQDNISPVLLHIQSLTQLVDSSTTALLDLLNRLQV